MRVAFRYAGQTDAVLSQDPLALTHGLRRGGSISSTADTIAASQGGGGGLA